MGFHTFDVGRASRLEEAGTRYRYCSAEELLGALALDGDETLVDIGSGTGFFTDDVAPHVAEVFAVDVQSAMHRFYREKGVPPNVDLVTAEAADMPFSAGRFDAAISTMTYHEFASDESLAELERVLRSGARLVVVDWSASGPGKEGPPVDERFAPADVSEHLDDRAFDAAVEVRSETWKAVATRI